MEIEAVDGLRVLDLGDGPNMFDADFVEALHRAVDAVVADAGTTMFVTVASGKHYSNGFDLEFLGGLELDELSAFMDRTSAALARILTLPVPTVAAVNGHAFGIGALTALAHDQRVQQRGPRVVLPSGDRPAHALQPVSARSRDRQALTADRAGGGAQRPSL